MELDEYRKHFELEETHWWLAGRRDILRSVLDGLDGLPANACILDAGCGTGMNLKTLERRGRTFGLDFHDAAVRYCQRRGLNRLVRADIQRMPFKNESFDLMFILDVLSHRTIKSDLNVLSDAYLLLKRGGFLIVCDSAFNFLLSRHDRAYHIRERYTSRAMVKKLRQAGFEVQKASYFSFFLFLPIVLVRLWDKLWTGDEHPPVSHLNETNRGVNEMLYRIFRAEAPLLRRFRLPFGSSFLCIARKT